MNSPTTARWFWEMGTREGLVELPEVDESAQRIQLHRLADRGA